jgi:AAA-ATPase Vps4-associated protein 1
VRKKDKDKETAAADGGASGEGKKDDEGKDKAASSSPSVPGMPSSPSATTSTFKRYSLHRDFYAMCQAEHRRRKKAKQTQELVPTFFFYLFYNQHLYSLRKTKTCSVTTAN